MAGKTILGVHRLWWPVFIVSGLLTVLDIPVTMIATYAIANPAVVTGRVPAGGWFWFAMFVMLEPTVAIAPLTYLTAKSIEDEKKREAGARAEVVLRAAKERARPRVVDVVPEDSSRAEEWRKLSEARERSRKSENVDGVG